MFYIERTKINMKFLSKNTQYEYNIEIYMPNNINEDSLIYYILDGLSYFQYAKETIRLQSLNTLKTNVENAVVVGIFHQEEDMRSRRFLDFTGPAEQYIYPERMNNHIPKAVGGAEAFHRFIELECKPYVHDTISFKPKREVIFGHSLSGYYVLWSLLHHPKSFSSYISISPSMWWNNCELLKTIDEKPASINTSVFLAVGEQECMILDDTKEFYRKLQPLIEKAEFYVGPEENHASIVPHSISRAFRSISN